MKEGLFVKCVNHGRVSGSEGLNVFFVKDNHVRLEQENTKSAQEHFK